MSLNDREIAEQIEQKLLSFHLSKRSLPGINDDQQRRILVEQMIESIHRVKYISVRSSRSISEKRADPNSDLFDPLLAAMLYQREGNIDEACWLVFLFAHFGKHLRVGYRYAQAVYGGLGDNECWTWQKASSDPLALRSWLREHLAELQQTGGHFGNHRKYLTLKDSSAGTGAAFESYIRWVDPPRNHDQMITEAYEQSQGDPFEAFDILYKSMKVVKSFGRTARFDYLTMLGKLGLAPIKPGIPYLTDSTGPKRGAMLLFTNSTNISIKPQELEAWLVELDDTLEVGMQVLEDSLCNWQKSPKEFVAFRG